MASAGKHATQAAIIKAKQEAKIEMGIEIKPGVRVPKDREEEFEALWPKVKATPLEEIPTAPVGRQPNLFLVATEAGPHPRKAGRSRLRGERGKRLGCIGGEIRNARV